MGIGCVGEQNEAAVGVLAQVVLVARGGVEREALHVGVALLVGVEEAGRPDLPGVVLLDAQDVVLVVIVHVEVRDVELAVPTDHQYLFVAVELAQELALVVVVQSLHVWVEPHLAATQRAAAVATEAYAGHVEFRHQVAHALAALDGYLGEVLVEEDALQFRVRFQRHLHHLGLAVGVGREVDDATARLALRQVVLTVAGHAGHVEALDVVGPRLAVAVNGVIDRARIILLEDGHVDDFGLPLLRLRTLRLAHEEFVGDAHHLVRAVLVEEDDVVDVGAVLHELVLLQARADEALLAVDVEFLIGLHHLGGGDGVEVLYLGQARMVLAVLLLDEAEPVGGHLHHVGQFLVYLGYLVLDAGDILLGLILVELQDAGHLYLHQAQDVVLRHLANHLWVPRGQSFVNPLAGRVHRLGVLELLVFVDALLDEYLFQGGEVQGLQQFALADESLLPEQVECRVGVALQYVAHRQETGLALVDDAAVGRDADLTVGAGIQRVDGLVAAGARGQVDEYFHARCRQVFHLPDLYLALLGSLQNAVDEGRGLAGRAGGLAEGNLRDGQRLGIALLNLGADAHRSATLSVVVLRHVD